MQVISPADLAMTFFARTEVLVSLDQPYDASSNGIVTTKSRSTREPAARQAAMTTKRAAVIL